MNMSKEIVQNRDIIEDLEINGSKSPKRFGASLKTVKFNV